jgi:hypothetical protein
MYRQPIDRTNPSCFLFLVDQSGSMADAIGGDQAGQRRKADGVSDAINRLLQNLTIRCTREEGVRHYYDIGVIGYGGYVDGPILGGSLQGRELVAIGDVADNPVRVEKRQKDDGAGGLVDFALPIWFDPVAYGGTPMCGALRQAHRTLKSWVATHPDAYPPIVINLTDGEATDGEPVPTAQDLRDLSTSDGNVLLFNCHISSTSGVPTLLPQSESELPSDPYAQQLFQMSSVLPEGLLSAAKNAGLEVGEGSRGFAFNAELVDVIRFLDIGTRTDTQLR